MRERRPARAPARIERELRERVVALGEQTGEERMARVLRLDQHLAGLVAAAGAARDLHDRLREPLVAAKVRAEKALIGVQHADERDVRKVVAFRQHLRADDDSRVAARRLREHRAERALARRRVAVETTDALVRIEPLQLLVDPLRSGADRRALRAAARTRPREAPRRAAMLTAPLAGRPTPRPPA